MNFSEFPQTLHIHIDNLDNIKINLPKSFKIVLVDHYGNEYDYEFLDQEIIALVRNLFMKG